MDLKIIISLAYQLLLLKLKYHLFYKIQFRSFNIKSFSTKRKIYKAKTDYFL